MLLCVLRVLQDAVFTTVFIHARLYCLLPVYTSYKISGDVIVPVVIDIQQCGVDG